MIPSNETLELLRHLGSRPGHDEVKADYRQLLTTEFGVELGALDFERRVPEVRGRIDALVGRTVFEAKSDLDAEWKDVARRMPDYLADREREEGERFAGIASDGLNWVVFELRDGRLETVKETTLDPERGGEFLAWLDGGLALKSSLAPDPMTVRAELGRESVAYRLVDQRLRALWNKLESTPAAYLKRQLWADLLRRVHGRDVDSADLWFQHTFLVVVAKCVALAVMRLRTDDPRELLSGRVFETVGVQGAVESDFFDWVVDDEEGVALVRKVMNHVRRFRLEEVESDVLKILYESLIDPDERHELGEYYTPDWLAAKVVRQVVDRPMEDRVIDPACGSGTFLFHAIRRLLAEAEDAGVPAGDMAGEVCDHIVGMDIHPVAVIIARVTYLLGLAPAFADRAGIISIPVYLGDAMQLSVTDIMTDKRLTIRVPPPAGEADGRETLVFPDVYCRDGALFDKAIEIMRRAAETGMSRSGVEQAIRKKTEQHYRADLTPELELGVKDLGETYLTLDKLTREGRDTIWTYVARNLSRPLAYSARGGWASVLVGNPPWVALRHMSEDLQRRFKEMARNDNVWVGGKFGTQNDLCALFVARAIFLYLRSAGKLGLVLPLAALSRGQFERLRTGSFASVRVAWDEAWTMDDCVAPLFPVPSCAVFGRRRGTGVPMPKTVRAYSGCLPRRDAHEDEADRALTVIKNAPAPTEGVFTGGSPYREAFRQGATLVPRMLCLVERRVSGRLGYDRTAPFVVSRRNNQEKEPWKSLPSIEGKVEAEFLRPVLLGESVLPYRVFRPFEGVIPINGDGVALDSPTAEARGHFELFHWMRNAERIWGENSRSGDMTFVERVDYHGGLSVQFPISPLRVVYSASGTRVAACVVTDQKSVIEHKLYWMTARNLDEARYLVAILNSETLRAGVERFQSRGQWGARDFDKAVFNLPIPVFDPKNKTHAALASLSEKAEGIAAAAELPEGVPFQKARAAVRAALVEAGTAKRIDDLVALLLK